MVIYLNEKGDVRSVPSSVPQGTVLRSVTIIAPKSSETLVLKVLPPSQENVPDIVCQRALDTDGNIICTASIPADVTRYAGRAEYQLFAIDGQGGETPSQRGSFSVTRGVITDMPDTVGQLGNYSLAQIYELLANVIRVYDMVTEVTKELETQQSIIGTGELITVQQTLKGAINDIARALSTNTEDIERLWDTCGTTMKAELDPSTYTLTLRLFNDAGKVLSVHTIDMNVTTAKIKDKAVTSPKIADGAVTTEKIKSAAVTGDKIQAGSITEAKLSSALNNRLLALENQAFTSIAYDPATGTLTFTATDGTQESVDLPLELIVSGGYYDDTEGSEAVALALANGDEIRIPVDSMLSELITYMNGIREKIYDLQEAPPIAALSNSILLCTPTLAQLAALG